MGCKWLFDPRLLVAIDFFLGIASFCLQVAFLATYLYATNYDLVGTGIWAGIIFAATAGVAWSMDGKVDRLILGVGPCLSFICGILLFSLNIASLSEQSKDCPLTGPNGNIRYYCSTEVALDVMLMLCGFFAIPVNAFLVLFVFGIVAPS